MGGARTKMDENSEYASGRVASGRVASEHSLSPQSSVLSTQHYFRRSLNRFYGSNDKTDSRRSSL